MTLDEFIQNEKESLERFARYWSGKAQHKCLDNCKTKIGGLLSYDPTLSHCASCSQLFYKGDLCAVCRTCNDCGCLDYCYASSDDQ